MCLSPLQIENTQRMKNGDQYAYYNVPCSKCPVCLHKRVQGWVFRLKEEQKVSLSSAFLTLTYDDQHVPRTKDGFLTLQKEDFQLFMKRLRYHVNEDYRKLKVDKRKRKPLKMYSCGEYGRKYGRPHYHSIMFNLPQVMLDTPEFIASIWEKGHVHVGDALDNSMAYVAKYIDKKETDTEDYDKLGITREFSVMSNHLGASWMTPNIIKYYKNNLLPYIITEGGRKISMPTYYKKRIYNEEERRLVAAHAEDYYQSLEDDLTGKQQAEQKEAIIRKFHRNQQTKRNKF